MNSQFRPLARDFLILLTAATLTACGGGGGSSNPPPSSGNPPAPAPTPPPPSSPGVVVPPISATVQDITDNHRVGDNRWSSPQTDGAPIGAFNCIVNQPQDGAYNAHVSILLNNEPQAIPTYVGASPQAAGGHCFYTIHTHDSSGKVHVTAGAAGGTFTLGQLFQIWNQPLSNTNLAGITGLPIEIFVTENDTVTKVEEADWTNIQLKSHREITIGVGTPVAEIPNFTWTE
jgi:hypothetical protein